MLDVGKRSQWGRFALRRRQKAVIEAGLLRVLTRDEALCRQMEEDRQQREERKARVEAGGVPAPVRRWGKRTRRPQGDSSRLAAISARQMARHRGDVG